MEETRNRNSEPGRPAENNPPRQNNINIGETVEEPALGFLKDFVSGRIVPARLKRWKPLRFSLDALNDFGYRRTYLPVVPSFASR